MGNSVNIMVMAGMIAGILDWNESDLAEFLVKQWGEQKGNFSEAQKIELMKQYKTSFIANMLLRAFYELEGKTEEIELAYNSAREFVDQYNKETKNFDADRLRDFLTNFSLN